MDAKHYSWADLLLLKMLSPTPQHPQSWEISSPLHLSSCGRSSAISQSLQPISLPPCLGRPPSYTFPQCFWEGEQHPYRPTQVQTAATSDKGNSHSCSIAAVWSKEVKISFLSRAREPDPKLTANSSRTESRGWGLAAAALPGLLATSVWWGVWDCCSKVASVTCSWPSPCQPHITLNSWSTSTDGRNSG